MQTTKKTTDRSNDSPKVDLRLEVLKELYRVCGDLIVDRVDWEQVEKRSIELFRGVPLHEQEALLLTLDSAVGRLRSGLIKLSGVYRFREVLSDE